AFSALIRVGKKSTGGARHAESGIFVPRGQSHLRPRVEDVTKIGRSDPVLVIVVAVTPVVAQMGEAGGVIKCAVRAGQASELAVESEAPAFAREFEFWNRRRAAVRERQQHAGHSGGSAE